MLSMDIFNNYYYEEPFFFLDAVSIVWLCCPSLCSVSDSTGALQTGKLAHPPSGVALFCHGRCWAAQLSSAQPSHPDSCLPPHCFPACNQDSSSCLILRCLFARSSAWSWGCNLVRLPSRESRKKRPALTDPELGSETARPKC